MMEKYEIQKLRELPIEKVAKEMGMKVEHHKALCPFHDDHHASLTFNKTKNSCRCYVCMRNSIGTIDLAMRYLGKDFPAACRWLAEEHQIQLEEDSSSGSSSDGSSSGDNSGKSSFDASRYARFFEHPWLNQAARRFLFEERKIDWRVVNWCRLTSWTDKKGINWLQIPYFDTDGRLIGIQNRNLDYTKKNLHREVVLLTRRLLRLEIFLHREVVLLRRMFLLKKKAGRRKGAGCSPLQVPLRRKMQHL